MSYGLPFTFIQSLTEWLLISGRFCVEISSTRTQQKATKDSFSALARNSAIPIVVVGGTKKDVYWNTKFGESRKQFALLADLQAHADAELDNRMREIEDEVDSITDGRCDAIVAVSKGM